MTGKSFEVIQERYEFLGMISIKYKRELNLKELWLGKSRTHTNNFPWIISFISLMIHDSRDKFLFYLATNSEIICDKLLK